MTPTQPSPGAMSAARLELAAKILAALTANPAVHAHNPMSGWGLVNCGPDDIVGMSLDYADRLISAHNATASQPHTARPDVDELVKALEETLKWTKLFADLGTFSGVTASTVKDVPILRCINEAESALTRHRDRAQNGGGL